ncbi:MAG: metallophosphoesterase [Candidatus Wukongarchaeota archaeon]|nr:metallophosphoesterase [Candidatus Wukongarchaeota archaeon]
MKLFETLDIKTINGLPILYIPSINAITVADLHLGYEEALANKGIFYPKSQFNIIMKLLVEGFEKTNTDILIINGDLKHEFGRFSLQERKEIEILLKELLTRFKKIIIVRGNHDNYLINIIRKFENVEFISSYLTIGKYGFAHGHELSLDLFSTKVECIVIAHEHPALGLKDDVYVKIKVPAVLFGETKVGKKIVVQPALSPIVLGVEVNMQPQSEFLSPILRDKKIVDIGNLEAIALDIEAGAFRFPKLKKWQKILQY